VVVTLYDEVGPYEVDTLSYSVYCLVKEALSGSGLLVGFGDDVTHVTSGEQGSGFICIYCWSSLNVEVYVGRCVEDIGDFGGVLSDGVVSSLFGLYEDIGGVLDVVFCLADPDLAEKIVEFVTGICDLGDLECLGPFPEPPSL